MHLSYYGYYEFPSTRTNLDFGISLLRAVLVSKARVEMANYSEIMVTIRILVTVNRSTHTFYFMEHS